MLQLKVVVAEILKVVVECSPSVRIGVFFCDVFAFFLPSQPWSAQMPRPVAWAGKKFWNENDIQRAKSLAAAINAFVHI